MADPSATRVDLNADAGEGYGRWSLTDDEGLLGVVTTVNLACGFHAGDPLIMRRVCALAVERGVAVGAQPGLQDLWGFGRRRILGERPEDIATQVLYQVGALEAVAGREGVRLAHVKLHGALGNQAAVDTGLAAAVAGALAAHDPRTVLLVPTGSALEAAAVAAGLRAVAEIYADRAYDEAGDLVPRGEPGAVLSDPEAMAAHALAMVRGGGVLTPAGRLLPRRVESVCVHGDAPWAVEAARRVRAVLEGSGVLVAAFSSSEP